MPNNAHMIAEMKGKYSAGAAFNNARQDMARTEKQGKALNNQFRLIRGGMGQMGHQVQDIAVQLQGGQSFLTVLGQQGSQILSLMGPHGAVVGAILAVGAALATAFIPKMGESAKAMQALNKEADGLIDQFDKLSKSLQDIAFRRAQMQIQKHQETIASAKEEINSLNNGVKMQNAIAMNNEKIMGEVNAEIKTYQDNILLAEKAIAELTAKTDENSNETEALIKSLTSESNALGLTRAEQIRLTDAYKQATPENQKIIDQQIEKIELYDQIVKGMEEEQKAIAENQKAQEKAQKDAAKLKEKADKDFVTREEQMQKTINALTQKKQKEDEKKQQKLLKDQEEFQKAMESSYAALTSGMADGFTNAITGAENFAEAMKGVAKSVVDSLIRMLIQKYIVDAAFGVISAGITRGMTSANAGYGFDMSDPFVPTYEGGGFTGSGSRSGGVDGRGGFNAILHPNETVIDHSRGQSMGGIVVNQTINVTTGVQQTVRAEIATLMPQIANAAKSAVADARMRGGSYSKSLVGA